MRVKVKLISGETKFTDAVKLSIDAAAKALGLSRKHIVGVWREY